ncbi:MAG: hypothetical protein M0R80_03275 [Proteobacteria bacterium]|jgi:hypothetical protein|nr:hypothetical protein [Pseudomonadota bacterium]
MACSKVKNLSQQTLLGMTANTPTGNFLNKIPLSQWEVFSFDPKRYEACVKVYRVFNQAEIQAYVDNLRTELAITTDLTTKLALQQVILEREKQLNNPPFNMITVPLAPP